MSVRYEHGDLLDAPVEAIVNTVNTKGVMGKGIALQVKQRWPEVDREYRAASKRGSVVLGTMHVVERGGLGDGPLFVINFPTKDHWRSRSKVADIESGLEDLRRVVVDLGIRSLAVPPLGCGNGGLNWADVGPLIQHALDQLTDVDVIVFPPEGAPAAADMKVGTKRPNLTPTLAGLICLIDRYWADVLGITDIEIQKLAYFLGVRRPELRLLFERGHYGPYCENLHFVLQKAEGHFVRGYGDRSRRPWEPAPLELIDDAVPQATDAAQAQGMTRDLDTVASLIEGFEGAWGMELLSTVHWVATTEANVTGPAQARDHIARWSTRKNRLFPIKDVADAWHRLEATGWFVADGAPATLF